MPDLDVGRVNRYLLTIRENTEDIRGLITRYEDDLILKDRYLLKALKYCLIEIAEATPCRGQVLICDFSFSIA